MPRRVAFAALDFSAHRRRAAGNARGGGVLATDREPVAGSRLGYWSLAPTTPAGQATQTIAGAVLAMASTVGLFSG
jgi:hypothetical protein